MSELEALMAQYPQIEFVFGGTPYGLDGLNIGNRVIINSELSEQEQLQWLYEELGHIATTVGDISDYHHGTNSHDETVARHWGMRRHVPKEKIDKLTHEEFETDDEAAADLGVQTDYLHEVGKLYGLLYKW